MRKRLSLLLSALLLAACYPETLPDLSSFKSSAVDIGTANSTSEGTLRLLILNQGLFPSYSSIDLLDFNTQLYYSDLFTQANPMVPQNLGTEASDMAVVYGQLWVLLYSSSQIAVVDLPSFKIVEFLPVDFPRHMVIDGPYVYVTSYGVSTTSKSAAVGKIYKINAATRGINALYIGSQPEGLAVMGEKLYIADSGHLSWPRSNKVSIINLKKFTSEKTVDLPLRHPNQEFSRGGRLWINTMGDSDIIPSGIVGEEPELTIPHSLIRMGASGSGLVIEGVHAERMALDHNTLYIYGNAAELEGGTEWHLYKVDADGDKVTDIPFAGTDLDRMKFPSNIFIHPDNGDLYFCEVLPDGSSQILCFDNELNFKWTVPAGPRTVHLLFWDPTRNS